MGKREGRCFADHTRRRLIEALKPRIVQVVQERFSTRPPTKVGTLLALKWTAVFLVMIVVLNAETASVAVLHHMIAFTLKNALVRLLGPFPIINEQFASVFLLLLGTLQRNLLAIRQVVTIEIFTRLAGR